MKRRNSPFAHHALERICERYDICLTKRQQQAFAQRLRNPKFTIRLTKNRLACYFENQWYLLAVSTYKMPSNTKSSYAEPSFTVQTFLRLEDANDDDKLILRHNERYIKINNDAFRVLPGSQRNFFELPNQDRVQVGLPDLTDEDDLPQEEFQAANRILKSICDEDEVR